MAVDEVRGEVLCYEDDVDEELRVTGRQDEEVKDPSSPRHSSVALLLRGVGGPVRDPVGPDPGPPRGRDGSGSVPMSGVPRVRDGRGVGLHPGRDGVGPPVSVYGGGSGHQRQMPGRDYGRRWSVGTGSTRYTPSPSHDGLETDRGRGPVRTNVAQRSV